MKNKSPAKNTGRGKAISIIIFILILLGIVAGIIFAYQRMFPSQVIELNAALSAIQKDSLDPIGAVERKEVAAVTDKRKEDCWSEICPNIQRSWFTPVAVGDEKRFLKDMLLRQGFVISYESPGPGCEDNAFLNPCHLTADKGDLHIQVSTQENTAITHPDKKVDPKRWLYTIINIDRR